MCKRPGDLARPFLCARKSEESPGQGAAYAAKKIGTNEIKGNSITTTKIKKNAITTAKIENGAVTGAKVNLGMLGTVPNSSTTDEVQSSKGTLAAGQEVTAFQYGPLNCRQVLR